ncbi:hypothetical protein BJF79_09880 [Actinomadura sp. CNU-125]|uniref:hypothetical protein n=1 Tax=Actinomadura sp. CNU-125 TaxID=1904961 RepID=UPI0009666D91|nr:hypothetical protein [Actinomadura sp. CNU-125]OLT30204.1 hypothetical protein BJF79_09880 [Actinomadura sp. CNU-125]
MDEHAARRPDLGDGFDDPYIDVDEWRDEPVRHRYVHGGFTGTATRFSIYLPPAERYRGRFFQHITPVPESELLAQGATGQEDRIGFAADSGAYFLETNGGGASGTPGDAGVDPTIAAYRANAAAARFSREVARRCYGEHRAYGYAYGGSGGGYRTIGGAESTTDVWDGFVPYVIGSPMAIPNVFAVRMHAQRVLRGKLDRIVDAVEPGSGRDMYDGLDDEERAALREVTRMGFPPRSWFGHRTMGIHAFGVLYPHIVTVDPGYFDDFWTVEGYLGADPGSSVHRDRVRHRCEVTETIAHGGEDGRGGVDESFRGPRDGAAVTALRLSAAPPERVQAADLVIRTGAAAGVRRTVREISGDVAVIDVPDRALDAVRPGDAVEIDNGNFLAAQTYHRHQVPGPEYAVWDQFRLPDGSPALPQRPMLLGPLFAEAAAGHVQTGRFTGKMIVVACLLDREAFPWQADWYRSKVREHLGERTDDRFRLWYVDNALHADDEAQEDPTRSVPYLGVLHRALRDLSAWVETGRAPAPSTAYTVADGQVRVAADGRGGVQPVVALTVDGSDRADVPPGRDVTLRAVAAAPGGTGAIVAVEWDLDGSGAFAVADAPEPAESVTVERRCSFDEPGTYFVTVRVAAHRDGDTRTPYGRIYDLARVRVVVG